MLDNTYGETEITEEDDYLDVGEYSLELMDDGRWKLTGFWGDPGQFFTVPSELAGRKISAIGDHAFYGNEDLDIVHLSEGIEEIHDGAFGGCENLRSVFLPKSLRIIEDEAFHGSGLIMLKVPENVVSIGRSMCAHCERLGGVIFNSMLEEIPEKAFYCCEHLRTVEFPRGLKRIEESAFCSAGLVEMKLPEGLEFIGDSAFSCCSDLGGCIVIPQSVRDIEHSAFSCTSAVAVALLPGCTAAIGDLAFSMDVPEVNSFTLFIPPSVTEIGDLFDAEADFSEYRLKHPCGKLPPMICCEPGSAAMDYAKEKNYHTADYYRTVFNLPDVKGLI